MRLLLALVLALALVPVERAAAAGSPDLLGKPGFFNLADTRAGDYVVRDTVRRLDRTTGKTAASVNVLKLLDPGYVRERRDGIEQAVHCSGALWIVRNVPGPDPVIDSDADRLYWLTADGSGEVALPAPVTLSDVRNLVCAADGSAYANIDRFEGARYVGGRLFRAAREGVTDVGKETRVVATRAGAAFIGTRRGETTLLDADGSRTKTKPRNARALGIATDLAYDGTDLYLAINLRDSSYELRSFKSTGGGIRIPTAGAASSTFCGGIVVSRSISLTVEEIIFIRRGRVVRRVRADRAGVMLDPRAGLYAVGRSVYRACGASAGRRSVVLPAGTATGSAFLQATSSGE